MSSYRRFAHLQSRSTISSSSYASSRDSPSSRDANSSRDTTSSSTRESSSRDTISTMRESLSSSRDSLTRDSSSLRDSRITPNSLSFTRASPLRSTWATARSPVSSSAKIPASPSGELDRYDVSTTVKSKDHSLPTGTRDLVGFATLPDQVHRKSVKKGFEFTLMVVGESGLGKSTLVNSLFLTDLYQDRAIFTAEERIRKTVEIEKCSQDIEEAGVRLRLTILDTPGFGDAVDCAQCCDPIVDYIDQQFEQYYQDESGLNRKNILDNRVHCCLYFISPFGHGLRPIDIEFMKRLHHKVNIVPVIAKSDCLTPAEVQTFKERILDEVDENNIKIYNFPECDSDEDEETKKQTKELKEGIPFAVIGSNTVVEVNGKKIRGRLYPWGITEVENPKHCDFIMLRNMLIRTHMQDLKDVTRDVHYENFRLKRIQKSGDLFIDGGGNDSSKDQMLKQKEQELKQMQEMLRKMQLEMARQKGGVGQNNNLIDDSRSSSSIDM